MKLMHCNLKHADIQSLDCFLKNICQEESIAFYFLYLCFVVIFLFVFTNRVVHTHSPLYIHNPIRERSVPVLDFSMHCHYFFRSISNRQTSREQERERMASSAVAQTAASSFKLVMVCLWNGCLHTNRVCLCVWCLALFPKRTAMTLSIWKVAGGAQQRKRANLMGQQVVRHRDLKSFILFKGTT